MDNICCMQLSITAYKLQAKYERCPWEYGANCDSFTVPYIAEVVCIVPTMSSVKCY